MFIGPFDKAILRQGALLLLSLALLYAGLLGLTLLIAPPPPQERGLDASLAGNTIFMTEPKYIYLDRASLREPSEKIVLLGASNVDVGFNLGELRPLLPASVALNKLAVDGANITEVSQVIDLVQQVQGEEARRHEIFVLGIWYGMFGRDHLRWYTPDRSPGDTDIDIERYRYGFERRTAQGPVPVVQWQYFGAAVTAIYPFLFLDKLSRDVLAWLSHRYQTQTADPNSAVMSQSDRDGSMSYWRSTMGSAGPAAFDEQFAVLERACKRVLAEGSKLLLVDLPLPKWHRERSPYEGYYEARRAKFVKQWAARPGFSFMDMSDMDRDQDFLDEVHPRPRVTILWARRLAQALSPMLSPNAAVAGLMSPNPAVAGVMSPNPAP
ncbi:MAG TPA: hypothetical protein VHT52_12820 [Stellaceae bacterium]|nr:hypothetical protein [Stellaceae bacterium]